MFLIRRSGETWHEPAISEYANEEELQGILKTSPTLLPSDRPMALVDEFSIPSIGSADLVGIDDSAAITVVECKLKANPQIRREVVGQALAYAGGLWQMPYEQFSDTFAKRAGKPLTVAVMEATGASMEEDSFRDALTTRLSSGDFRLVIAVDEITPELKLIIEYLNGHTLGSLQVLALELRYTKDGDVELLSPSIYGEELATSKASTSSTGTKWNTTTFGEEVEGRTEGAAQDFIKALLAHGSQNGHHPFFGAGHTPGMSYYYELDGTPTSVWALYLKDSGPVMGLSLGAISKWSVDATLQFLAGLREDSALSEALADIDESSLNKYPNIPIKGALDQPATRMTLFNALDRLIERKR